MTIDGVCPHGIAVHLPLKNGNDAYICKECGMSMRIVEKPTEADIIKSIRLTAARAVMKNTEGEALDAIARIHFLTEWFFSR